MSEALRQNLLDRCNRWLFSPDAKFTSELDRDILNILKALLENH